MAITGWTLEIEAVFSETAEMMAGSEFSRVWASATEISLERDVAYTEEATVTTIGVAQDNGAKEDEVKNRPADRMLKVERGWEMLTKKPAILRSRKVRSPHEPHHTNPQRWADKAPTSPTTGGKESKQPNRKKKKER